MLRAEEVARANGATTMGLNVFEPDRTSWHAG